MGCTRSKHWQCELREILEGMLPWGMIVAASFACFGSLLHCEHFNPGTCVLQRNHNRKTLNLDGCPVADVRRQQPGRRVKYFPRTVIISPL
jgi:hypothetical protein